MKNLKIMSLLLLVILCVPFFPLTSVLTPGPLENIEASRVKSVDPVPPSPEPPHLLFPLRLLVYTEYSDDIEETVNVFTSINVTYGTDYSWTNLTDYNNLNTLLSQHDILLILEQELAPNIATLETIGTAWASILPNWVSQGGIVIALDCYAISAAIHGPTGHLMNRTGLMDFYNPTAYSTGTHNVVNQSNALAQGVPATYSATDGSVRFDTTTGTVVVEHSSTQATVVHRILGQGHVAFLGFDMFLRSPDVDTILANALRLYRHIVFDASHTPYGDIFTGYTAFAADIVADNFAVSSMGTFSPAFFAASDHRGG